MYAVRAAQVFDGTGFLAGGATVLVEEGRIAGVEPFGCDLPHDCEVTTFTGTLLPGLIDTQVHLVTDGGPAALDRVAGCTEEELDTVRPGDQPPWEPQAGSRRSWSRPCGWCWTASRPSDPSGH
jgi:hypothetical protein